MPDRCGPDGLDDKYPVRPPRGEVQLDVAHFREWDEIGPLAAAFTRHGRYVACGES